MGAPDTYSHVKAVLAKALDAHQFPASFRPILEIALGQRGRVLSGDPAPRWSTLVLSSCVASGGNIPTGACVAAAVECFIAGADLIDDIQDGDPSPVLDVVGLPQGLNAAAALLVLAHAILDGLDEYGVPVHRVPTFTRTLSHGALRSAGGQHLDLLAEGQNEVGTADAYAIVRSKAGTLAGMATRLGALVGTDDAQLLSLYEAFGTHMGVIAQINNDLLDAQSTGYKTDVARQKSTLPLVYNRSSHREVQPHLPHQRCECSVDTETRAFVEVVLTAELHHARAVLDELAGQGQDVAPLVELLG